VVLPAMPLALTAQRRLDERRQRALCRYYLAAGAGGLAVGVHTTQFAIRAPAHGLLRPVLALAAEEMGRHEAATGGVPVRIAGVCGGTAQAVAEASLARELGYHAGLLSLAALKDADDDALLAHCRAVGEVLPLVGFYLQPAVGGRILPYRFWRRFAEIERVTAIKIAPFNRYQTLDVIRAVAETGRDDIALYTGNDDQIVLDLVTPFRFRVGGRVVERRIVGGLLGQWAVWTRQAVLLLEECHALAQAGGAVPAEMLRRAVEITDANAAVFDVAHGFAGCIAGIHEVLRRQGLLEGTWCLDPRETLSPSQAEEIDRVYRAYPHLNDDEFVARRRDGWLGKTV
jgi:dihydrodipicolinate synthase/N-acetylneuraminate lyase